MDLSKQLKNPDLHYRPIPFWSWNEELSCEETSYQIDQMHKAGIGGYFMHARGGLQTPYMGEEWMDNIRTGIRRGSQQGMSAWGYDENGWPSGFGDGEVNGLGVAYQQKYLRYEWTKEPCETETTITNRQVDGKNCHFYYEVNPFYVDTLDSNVTKKFIQVVYERYKQRLGDEFKHMAGFFTDEPQISRNGIPWSFILTKEYFARYQDDLLSRLPDLFFNTSSHAVTRIRFYSLIRDLFAENFMGQIYEWCNRNGSQLTGHVVLEETLESQLVSNGSCMPSYEYMHIPGMDWLCRFLPVPATVLQLTSAGHQLGKKQMISETFALCGWNVAFEDLKWLYEAQMARGVNLLCQHLEGYSLRGIRKRDYPASLFIHQPWWEEYRYLNDALSRVGVLLTEGKVAYPVLLLHPQSSAWIRYNRADNSGMRELENSWKETIRSLESRQVLFHLGDERLIERHGRIEQGTFVVGTQHYKAVVVPPMQNLCRDTFNKLLAFSKQGGEVVFTDQTPVLIDGKTHAEDLDMLHAMGRVMPMNDMAEYIRNHYAVVRVVTHSQGKLQTPKDLGDQEMVLLAVRAFEDQGAEMIYLVNTGETARNCLVSARGSSVWVFDPFDVTLTKKACLYDEETGECRFDITLQPRGSEICFVERDAAVFLEAFRDLLPAECEASTPPLGEKLSLDPDCQWDIVSADENALTLDYCTCYFDGELVGRDIPVNNIQEMAIERKRETQVRMEFSFLAEEWIDQPVTLVIETPEKYEIFLNGYPVEPVISGYYRDKSFKRIRLPDRIVKGENNITCVTRFRQSPKVYENIEKSLIFESEKNKLTYDDEIECIYLIGDFAVKTDGEFTDLDRNALRYSGTFRIAKRPENLSLRSIVPQGFPFFCGSIKLKRSIVLDHSQIHHRYLGFSTLSATLVLVTVNGRKVGKIFKAPYELSLEGFLKEGENILELEFVGTLRNLLGPHHLKEGECFRVGPFSFFQHSKLWNRGENADWTDDYCFVNFVGES